MKALEELVKFVLKIRIREKPDPEIRFNRFSYLMIFLLFFNITNGCHMSMESTRCLLSEFSFKIRKSGKKSGKNPDIRFSHSNCYFFSFFLKKKCRCHAFANCEFLLFQVKNGTNLHASNVNISACGRFIKLPITPLSQNVMD